MILNNDGFLQFTGVSDAEDSPVASCLNELFSIGFKIDAETYIKENGMYQRCANSKYLFSRDQTICLFTLLKLQGMEHLVSLDRVDGKDLFSPSVRGHERRCKGLKASWFQDKWLWLDIWYHATFTPREEPNQLLCMMTIADPKFLKYWCRVNPLWQFSILDYFITWRDEIDLAAIMITKIKAVISV